MIVGMTLENGKAIVLSSSEIRDLVVAQIRWARITPDVPEQELLNEFFVQLNNIRRPDGTQYVITQTNVFEEDLVEQNLE